MLTLLQATCCDTSLIVSGGACWWREKTTKCLWQSFNITPKTTEEHLIARSGKSVAYVTNNKILCSTFCILLKLTTDRHEASRGLHATAELLVCAIWQWFCIDCYRLTKWGGKLSGRDKCPGEYVQGVKCHQSANY